MTIEELNRLYIDRYLQVKADLRSSSSYPFLISFKRDFAEQEIVPIYFKQPRDWLSTHYDEVIAKEKLYDLLMVEYQENILSSGGFSTHPLFNEYCHRIRVDNRPLKLVYNNIVKFSFRSGKDKYGRDRNPDCFDGSLVDQFNDLIGDEYKIIQPVRSVFCVGPEEDYAGLMSWKMLNDTELKKLSKQQPYNIYTDFNDNLVLHTYHPSYWFKFPNLKEVVYNFIIGNIIAN